MAVMQNSAISPVEGVHNDKPFSQFGMARGRHQPTRFWTLVSPCFDAVYGDYGAFVLVDTLLKALGLAACSQGTMNNLIFGNERYGYYETLGGGCGAGPGFDGASAVHSHMTNTRITDPEILEHRFPVRVVFRGFVEQLGGSWGSLRVPTRPWPPVPKQSP